MAQRRVEQRQFPTRKETLDDHGHGAHADHQEAVEDQQVVEAGDRVVEHLLLTEGIDQHVFESLAETVESIVRTPAPEQLKPPAQRQDDGADSDNRENPEPDDPRDPEKRSSRGVMHDPSFNKERAGHDGSAEVLNRF